MPRSHPRLAKLTRPRLYGAVPRERLFSLLDRARHRSVIYVAGPPGAGKTTLVASWLDSRGIPGTWYQVDPGDADLATLFHYLREAVRPFLRKGQRLLPLMAAEYSHDVEGFARQFFRQLFNRLPPGAVLAFDNCQEVESEHGLHRLIALAANEVPEDQTLIVISRRDPPEPFTRLIANGSVSLLDWAALKLTLDETRVIAAVQPGLDACEVEFLFEKSSGWVAGLTLLIEQGQGALGPGRPAQKEGLERVFDYFASQIFVRMAPEVQRFVMATAFLPRVTVAMAESLTGNADARTILQDLYRRHLFTHRHPSDEAAYQYHALFREFLREKALSLLDDGTRWRLAVRAAQLLEKSGDLEDAFVLYCESSELESACALVLRFSERLLAQGRFLTVIEWTNALSAGAGGTDPWLQYWRGLALMSTDLPAARRTLESAFNSFVARADPLGQTMAAAGVLEVCFYEYAAYKSADFWLRSLKESLAAAPRFPSTSIELKVYCAAMIGLLFRQPGDPMLPACVRRVMELQDADLDADRRMAAAAFLFNYCTFAGDFELGNSLLARMGALLAGIEASEFSRYYLLDWFSYYLYLRGDYAAAEQALQQMEAIQESFPHSALDTDLWLIRSLIALNQRNPAVAQRSIEAMDKAARTNRPLDRQFRLVARAWLALSRESWIEAIEVASAAVSVAEPLGVPFWQVAWRIPLVLALVREDKYGEARGVMVDAKALLKDTCLLHMDTLMAALEAFLLLKEERTESKDALRELFANVRRRDHGGILDRLHSIMPELCSAAWSAGMERETVRALVRRFDWPPPSPRAGDWPWPIRIFTLGRFRLEIDNEPVQFSGRAPRKVLALLKALVAFGAEQVPRGDLIEALWGDAEGDAAEAALDVAIARLRKLLGRQNAVLVSNEEITLNRACCWVDRFAFDCLEDDAQSPTDSANRLLSLYKGEFLPADQDASWSIRARSRLRTGFGRHLIRIGAGLENRKSWHDAISLYERGLEVDDTIEELYQGLMRCHRALGQSAQGIDAFSRLRQALADALGVPPSPASEALAGDLRKAAPSSGQA